MTGNTILSTSGDTDLSRALAQTFLIDCLVSHTVSSQSCPRAYAQALPSALFLALLTPQVLREAALTSPSGSGPPSLRSDSPCPLSAALSPALFTQVSVNHTSAQPSPHQPGVLRFHPDTTHQSYLRLHRSRADSSSSDASPISATSLRWSEEQPQRSHPHMGATHRH